MDNQQQSYNESKTYCPNLQLGTIIILKRIDQNSFLVKCSNCGREFEVKISTLAFYKKNPPSHCKKCKGPATPRKYKPGDIFGIYELLEFVEGNNWKVKCKKCGTIQTQSISNLKKIKSEECYYCTKDISLKNPNREPKQRGIEIDQRIYSYYKSNVNSHNRSGKYKEFKLTLSEYSQLIHSNCFYCGEPPSTDNQWNKSSKRLVDSIPVAINGIDRIDSNKGYTMDNCVPCCPQCNRMKLDYSTDNFLKKIKKIYCKMFNDQSKDVAPSGCEMEDSEIIKLSDEDMVSSIQ